MVSGKPGFRWYWLLESEVLIGVFLSSMVGVLVMVSTIDLVLKLWVRLSLGLATIYLCVLAFHVFVVRRRMYDPPPTYYRACWISFDAILLVVFMILLALGSTRWRN